MTSKRNNNYIHLYVCAPVVYVSIGKLQPGIQNLESASARNVLRWAHEVKGVLSFLFSLLEAIHKRWLPFRSHRAPTYIPSPTCERPKEKKLNLQSNTKGRISKINNPTVFCIFLN